VPYDYLVLAPGSVTNFFGIPGLAETALGIKGLSEAVAVRNHLLECFERAIGEPDPGRRAALLTFVVAGGGPTGVELAGALVELIRHVLAHDYRGLDLTNARVVLVEAGPALLPALPADLQKAAGRDLRQKGVDVRLGTGVRSFQDDVVALATGENLPAATLLWAAGVRATDLGSQLGAPLERQGRVKVEPTLQLTDHPEVFVIGDLAHFAVDGAKPLPMVAPVAIQQGDHVALNLRRQLAGRPLAPFTYHDKGTMATIGRNSAVCQIGPFHLTGFLAWVAWLAVHLLQIVSFRNRLLVLVNWIWDYFFYDSAVRLITRD
jgi:NADH dehydrogenase